MAASSALSSEPRPQRKRLVLDAGGVLYGEQWRTYLAGLAEKVGRPGTDTIDHYNGVLRQQLWKGEFSLDQFWDSIAHHLGYDDEARAALIEESHHGIYEQLPAVERLKDWAEAADELWILSNHRHEWLRPALEAAQADKLFTRIIISSEVGQMKPDPEIYASLRDGDPAEVMFVDDKPENLDAAVAAGTVDLVVEADKQGKWMNQVEAWLGIAA